MWNRKSEKESGKMHEGQDDELKALLSAEIRRDERRVAELRQKLGDVEPRLRRAKAYFVARFGEDALSEPGSPVPNRRRPSAAEREADGLSHAERCAAAVTQANRVGEPMSVDEIRRLLIGAGLATTEHPTRQTLFSTVGRSELFAKLARGRFALKVPYRGINSGEPHTVASAASPPDDSDRP
jgi:hypothetical protein